MSSSDNDEDEVNVRPEFTITSPVQDNSSRNDSDSKENDDDESISRNQQTIDDMLDDITGDSVNLKLTSSVPHSHTLLTKHT